MSWTTPATWVVGAILTAAQLNTHLRDNTRYLKGLDGVVTTQAGLIIDNTLGTEYFKLPSLTTTQRDALTPANGMVIYNSTLNLHQRRENGAWVSYNDLASMVIASQAQGDIFYAPSATAIARLGYGTSGYFLKTQGAAANPIWSLISVNRCFGLTPTATGWTTPPTTLTNATDNDLTTVTGEGTGQAQAGEAEDINEITIDLGSIMAISRIMVKVGFRTANALETMTVNLRAGESASHAGNEVIGTAVTTASTSEVVRYIQGSPTGNASLVRYVSLYLYGNSGNYASYMKLYEVIANA